MRGLPNLPKSQSFFFYFFSFLSFNEITKSGIYNAVLKLSLIRNRNRKVGTPLGNSDFFFFFLLFDKIYLIFLLAILLLSIVFLFFFFSILI